MNTVVNIKTVCGKALLAKCRNLVYACLQRKPAMTRVCGHFVGAFGVVGFSGVKDSRKSVQIADASASACNEPQIQPKTIETITVGSQKDNQQGTEGKQSGNSKVTKGYAIHFGVRDEA